MSIKAMVERHINEGIPYGSKQRQAAFSRKNVLVGIEYEFYAYRQGTTKLLDTVDIKQHFKEHLSHIPFSKIVPEHDSQVELVTDPMTIDDSLRHLNLMFKEFQRPTDGVQLGSSDHAGLHISISYTDHSEKTFNALKFATIMNSDYIHRLFPERKHVRNVDTVIYEAIKKVASANPDKGFNELIDDLENTFQQLHVDSGNESKYYSFKLSDYAAYNGRIELRFFGGVGYENMSDTIKDQLARSIYLLDIAYGDAFHNEYIKSLYKRFQAVVDTKVSTSVFDRARSEFKTGRVTTQTRKEIANKFREYLKDPTKYTGGVGAAEVFYRVYPQSFERMYDEIVEKLIAPRLSSLNVLITSPLYDRIAVDVLEYLDDDKKKNVIRDYIDMAEILSTDPSGEIEKYLSNNKVIKHLDDIVVIPEFDPRTHIKFHDRGGSLTELSLDYGSTVNSPSLSLYLYKNGYLPEKFKDDMEKFLKDVTDYLMKIYQGLLNDDQRDVLKPDSHVINVFDVAGQKEEFKEVVASLVRREYQKINSKEGRDDVNNSSDVSVAIRDTERQVQELLELLNKLN